jgi:hypothetical protein
MTVKYAFAFGSAVLAGLSLASTAHAVSQPQSYPANTLTYSAQSVAANGNAVTIPLSAFSFTLAGVDNVTTPPAVGAVFISPPPGTTFTLPAAGGAYFFDCGPGVKVTLGAGGSSPSNTAAPFAAVAVDANGNISNTAAFTAPCQNGDHVILNSLNNVGVTLSGASGLASAGGEMTLYAQYSFTAPSFGGDSAPFSLVTLLSADPVVFGERANNQLIDVSGTGGTPGTLFIGTGATPGTPSTAGFLGSISVRAVQLISASTGGPISTATAAPNAFPTDETVTITGTFTSIASAYLVAGSSTAAACTSPAPAGNVPATSLSATQLVFTIPAPANFATKTSWAVCVLNTAGAQIPTTSTTINATANNPASSPDLTAANTAFGSIAVKGVAALFQNVFGAANLYPTFFRVANPTGAPAPLFAVLARDGGATFVTAPGALSPVPANNAQFYSADLIALAAGTVLSGGSLHATVKLMSPTPGVVFSAVSQNAVTLDLTTLP